MVSIESMPFAFKCPRDCNVQLFTSVEVNQRARSLLTEPSLRLFIVSINVDRIQLLIIAMADCLTVDGGLFIARYLFGAELKVFYDIVAFDSQSQLI